MTSIGSTTAPPVQMPTVPKATVAAKPQATAVTGEAGGNQLFRFCATTVGDADAVFR